MSWRTDWQAISAQIYGLVESGKFHLKAIAPFVREDDHYKTISRRLIPHTQMIYETIREFKKNYTSLPSPVHTCLEKFIEDFGARFTPELPMGASAPIDIASRLTLLASLQYEITYYLSDFSAVAKRRSERAFIHLQRSIVADVAVRDRWREAFNTGETACEKLGGAHLLLHGIWAFKVNAEGERTDLVFGEPLTDFAEAEAAAEAVVLTEWKLVRNPADLERVATDAMRQASRYALGALGGLELAQYRYLVLVSEDVLLMPPDQIDSDVTYRHINIAVNPRSPSKK